MRSKVKCDPVSYSSPVRGRQSRINAKDLRPERSRSRLRSPSRRSRRDTSPPSAEEAGLPGDGQETKLHRLIRHARKSTSLDAWTRIIRRIELKGECESVEGLLGRLPLHCLAFSTTVATSAEIGRARRKALKKCLEKNKEALKARDSNGHTALHIACHSSAQMMDNCAEAGIFYEIDTEVVRLLTTPPLGDPSLLSMVKVKQEGVDRPSCATDGEAEEIYSMPLHNACECRPSVDLLKLLVKGTEGGEAMLQRDGQNQLPIHIAIDYGALEPAIRFLVEEWNRKMKIVPGEEGCSLNKMGLDDYRGLHFACNPGVDEEAFAYIVRMRPSVIWEKAGPDVDLPIHIAVCDMAERGFVSLSSATPHFKVR